MNEIDHLKTLIKTINDYSESESNFDKLYEILNKEFNKKTDNGSKEIHYKTYEWNLSVTIEDQAEMYREYRFDKKISKRNKRAIFDDFVKSFIRDIEDHLHRVEQTGSTSA